MLTSSFVFPSIIATFPISLRTTPKKFCQFLLCCGDFGLFSGSTYTFQLFFICSIGSSGGGGGSCCKNLARISISFSESIHFLHQLGIPRGVPYVMNTFIPSFPNNLVLFSGRREGPVAPLRGTSWHPAHLLKYIFLAISISSGVIGGGGGNFSAKNLYGALYKYPVLSVFSTKFFW